MDIVGFLQQVVDATQAQVLVYLLLVNLVLGVLAALRKGKFELARLKDFGLRTITVLGTYLGVSVASVAMADFTPMRTVAWAALVAFLATQILDNAKDLGLPVPNVIGKWLERK